MVERQIRLDRVNISNTPFVDSQYLPAILEKIKMVDTDGGRTRALFMEHYDLTFEEAERWIRHTRTVWLIHQADYYAETSGIDQTIRSAIQWRDHQIFWDVAKEVGVFDPEFVEHVEQIRQTAD